MRRKTISLITILAMMISLFEFNSFDSFSNGEPVFAGGAGTESDPWQIATAQQLDSARYYVGSAHRDKYFSLIADIDLNISPYNMGIGWTPIGEWWAHFDGAGYTIRGLFINNPMQPEWGPDEIGPAGLFGSTYGATINNINLTDVNITGSTYVGGLVGYTRDSVITNINISGVISGEECIGGISGYTMNVLLSEVHFIGTVDGLFTLGGLIGRSDKTAIRNASSAGTVSGEELIGGLIGEASTSPIINSHSESTVSGTVDSTRLGGLVGSCHDYTSIDRCYATGNVTGDDILGGLVGEMFLHSQITNSFATGNVSSTLNTENAKAAGLLGSISMLCHVLNCYATGNVIGTLTGGGLIGDNFSDQPIMSSFSLGPDNGYGSIVTAEQMKAQETFIDWNFESIWTIDEGASYPYLLPILTDAEIISLGTFSPIDKPVGTPLSSIMLPATVRLILDDTTVIPLMVHWDGGTPAYNGDVVGTYVFNGTLSVIDGIANTKNLVASITVNILPSPKAITRVEPLYVIDVPIGTPWQSITLPTNVIVTLDDNNSLFLPVVWDVDSIAKYDGNTVGTYTIIGDLIFSSCITNPLGLTASINVVVALPPDSPPDITRHPYNSDVLVGESTSFKVTYNAYPEPTFQWQISKNGGKRWTNIPGATLSVYKITEATIGMNGYLYRVILDNNIGDPITSSAGLLTVTNGFADLQISQVSTVFNDSNEILWEITVTNLGPDTAHGVVIKDPLASSTKFLNDSGSIEPTFKGKSIFYNVGSVGANDYVTVAIRVSIIRDVDSIKNTATVSTINLDDNLTNNSIESLVLLP